ncbi:MAG TPA: TrkA family potassium uptake protein [Bacillota bacterium]|jgi:trk system potassium uptake protein TrkA|nr:TrkA family potassium uptake protein [Candidatus Fermentithermobacillaceae bacterium]HOB29880.1 TrkA family potassium uptake protein [Bacillota bacterium]HOK63750.1 TrkA family potassium uptake protein [Bacillota bacterium]HOL11562.1 TrkA family potassium uptake protein [Bacillota bacterium]HOQ02619.1 TrkA family potassium uptake protein [Bacillota bacterium]
MRKQIAVIGLGRFGRSLATTLSKLGAEVLAVDTDPEKIQSVAPIVTEAVEADATNESVLGELGLRNFDVVVVAISEFEASLLITLYLKQLGVKEVIVKAGSDVHGNILERVGADKVIFPEKDMGRRLAYSLVSGSVIDYIELAEDYGVVEVPVQGVLIGKTLSDLGLRNRFGINIVGIRRNSHVNVYVNPQEPLREGDVMIAIGPTDGVQRFSDMLERR